MRLTSWIFLVPLWFSNQYISFFFFLNYFFLFLLHLPTQLRISYLVQLHFHSWSMYNFFYIIFALCLLYYCFDKLQFAKSKFMIYFKRSLTNFRQHNKNTSIFFLYDQFFISWVLARMTFSPTLLVFSEIIMNKKFIYFYKKQKQKKPTHLQSISWLIEKLLT